MREELRVLSVGAIASCLILGVVVVLIKIFSS